MNASTNNSVCKKLTNVIQKFIRFFTPPKSGKLIPIRVRAGKGGNRR